jgi:hypothetical protein
MVGTDGRDDEIDSLLDGAGVDTAAIQEQINKKRGVVTPPTDPKPPVDPKPPADPRPPTDPKPPVDPKSVPDPEVIVTGRLKEIFGDQFTNIEDLKKANIPEALKELTTLRQKNQELSDSLAKKPKHAFASDDIAKFNEFARETGIKDAGIFNKLNATDVANMNPMDALILQRIIEDPSLAGEEPRVRRNLEKRFNVDPKKVEAGELTQEELEDNLLDMRTDGNAAKKKLIDLKVKIKMPEPIVEETPQKKWTPEVEAKQKADWTKVSEKIGEVFAKIPILMEGAKEPIVDFVLPEETRKAIQKSAYDHVINNQMEVNEANIKSVSMQMYSDAVLPNLDKIAKVIFDRARSMTEEEFLRAYSGPTDKNNDKPDLIDKPLSDEEKAEKAYQAELNR